MNERMGKIIIEEKEMNRCQAHTLSDQQCNRLTDGSVYCYQHHSNGNKMNGSSRKSAERLPGLKWMRTLWVADITGGPYKFIATKPGSTHLGLENAHRNLKISPEEFDEVARILAFSLDHFKVPAKEKNEVLTAFIAHKPEVTLGFRESHTGM